MRISFKILLILILSLNFVYSQSIKRSVINSFGSSSSNGTIYLSETFGQPSNIGTVSDGNNFIRQGFEQPLNNLILIPGCTDPNAFNYDVNANTDDGSCIAVSLGCTDPLAFNYDVNATTDDGLCCYVSGCIDPNSCNFDSTACIDDGSCLNTSNDFTFLGNIDGCCYYVSNITMSWTSADSLCSLSSGHMLSINSQNESESLNILLGNTPFGPNSYWLGLIDGNSSWQNGDTLVFTNYDASYSQSSGQYMFMQTNGYWDNASNDGLSQTNGAGIHAIMELCSSVTGCTDETSTNFNELATIDDGSCIDAIYGCTDSLAFNFNVIANTDDGSCNYCSNDTSFTEVTACESYQWNGQTYTESGVYEYSEQNNNEFSMSLDGVDDYVELNNLNNTLNNFSDFSFIGHFKTDGSNSSPQQLIFSTVDNSYDAASIWLGIKNNQILFQYFDGSTQSDYLYYGNNLSDNQWHCIALSLDNQGDLFIYIDGIQVAHEISVQVDFNSANYFSLGHDWDPGPVPSDLFIGNLDNVAIWDIPLTSQDINQYMNCPPTGNEEGLVGYWNFEEGQGETVIDLSENGNDGTINSATYSTDVPEQSCQLTTVNGCDSIAVLNLTITQPDTSITEVTACESFEWNGETYTESGNYIFSSQYTAANAEIFLCNCGGGGYFNEWFSLTLADGITTEYFCENTSGVCPETPTGTWINPNDNISLLGLEITNVINNSSNFFSASWDSQTSIITISNNYDLGEYGNNALITMSYCGESCGIWQAQGILNPNFPLAFSGGTSYPLQNISSCDSVAVLNLTITQPDTSFTEVTACDEFTWDGQTYSESGEYTNTYANANGCDSIHTLNLTLNSSTINVDTQIHCNDYTWIDGVTYNQSNNSATYLLTDQYGCDSIVSLDLTISYSGGSIFVNACNSYEWNGDIYTESGTYINEYLSNNGCISNDTLQLNIDICGCTDEFADNYDPNATFEDGSCIYCNSFSVLLISVNDVSEIGGNNGQVLATGQGGSSNYNYNLYNSDGVPQNPFTLSAGTYTVEIIDYETFCIAYLEVEVNEPTLNFECTADGCIESSESENSFSSLEECELECSFIDPCDITPIGLYVDNIIHNRIRFNWSATDAPPSHYMIRYRAVGTNNWTVIAAGPQTPSPFNGTSRTRYFMEPETTYEWNIRARVLNEDGSINCQSDWSEISTYTTLPACANLENLSVSTEATWVTFFADAPDESWGVWQSKGKIREVGLNNYRYVNGDNIGNINGLKGNFTANTDYEWHTKAWCTGNVDVNGNSDPQYHSGWGEFSAFTTEELCDKLPINLSTATNSANTAVIMSWDSPLSGNPDHYFLEMTNNTSGAVYQWNNIPGADNSKTKFNQSPGDEISWRIRGACGTNGTSWATIFTQPTVYTLGGEKLQSLSLNSLEIYPNPSRDVFNIELSTENTQKIEIRVVNSIGQEIYRERVEVENMYTEQIDLSDYSKGIYNLTIITSDGLSNHKLILQ